VLLYGIGGFLILLVALGGGSYLWLHHGASEAQGPGTTGPKPSTSANSAPSTTSPSVPATAITPSEKPVANVDVVVYGTQTSGIVAAREITQQDPELRVAVVSAGDFLESPLAQGLSVEDARKVSLVSGGVYQEWRDDVIGYYHAGGSSALTSSGRLVYQPAVAAQFLWSFLRAPGSNRVFLYTGQLTAARDSGPDRYVELRLPSGATAHISTRYFIDASVEADLARMLGASYRIGRNEAVYDDVSGPTPAFPSKANNFVTAPQRFSALLTLKLSGQAVASQQGGGPDPLSATSGVSSVPLSPYALGAFARSWTLTIAKLPGHERELNEYWSDYFDAGTAYSWIFDPTKRSEITQRAVQRALGQVRYLQEHGYPQLTVANIPQYPYVREGPRVVGLATYTVSQILAGTANDVVAVGCYTEYDRHDSFETTQINTTTLVYVPMQSLMVKDHPWLLVSTAVSTDYRAYSSPVRTELARANMGGAAGTIVALAARLNSDAARVPYGQVRQALEARGYRLSASPPATQAGA
jgi:hypothetical protein